MAPTDTGLPRGQEIVLIVLQMITGLLSLIGSSIIVFKISRALFKQKKTTPYDRIMLGLSSCDFVSSAVYVLTPFLFPAQTSLRPWAFGNDNTCQFMGMLTQLAMIWAIWYNCLLSFYYLLTVRFRVKRETFRKRFELWFHLSGAIFFPVTALVGWFGRFYHEHDLLLLCTDFRIPTGCDEFGENCTGDADQIAGVIFAAMPGAITMISILVNNIIIYLYVRRSLKQSPPSEDLNQSQKSTNIAPFVDDDKSMSSSIHGESSRNQKSELQRKLVRETASQGFLYVLSFYVCYTPMIILLVLNVDYGSDTSAKTSLYALMVLSSLLSPLQGFLNVFIYVRPTYTRFRAKNPNESTVVVLKQALFDPKIPRLSSGGGSGNSSTPQNTASWEEHRKTMKGGSNFSASLDILDEVEEDDEELGSSHDDDNSNRD